ncbi:hypothetical protein KLN27_15195 [Clostridioides difficile]|nr:hypothetical protein [Clostridioides difficile]MDO0221590.1 hypothetical protein [Clostridioides difficile]HAT4871054.1 hypothetical protein [Clostridioides difficile]HBF9019387.1 hypothetical protein [Clostridioides difficile]HBG1771603.1 hypothetical protein [Clostridioides difficile]
MNIINSFKKLIKSKYIKNNESIKPLERIFEYEIRIKEKRTYFNLELLIYEKRIKIIKKIFLKDILCHYRRDIEQLVIYDLDKYLNMTDKEMEEYIINLIKDKIKEEYGENILPEILMEKFIKLERKGSVTVDVRDLIEG